MRKILFFILFAILISSTLVLAKTVSVKPPEYRFYGYSVEEHSGNESVYNITLSEGSDENHTVICLKSSKESHEVTVSSVGLLGKGSSKKDTYRVPFLLPLEKNDMNLTYIPRYTLDGTGKIIFMNSIFIPGWHEYAFCYDASHETDKKLRFGESSVVTITNEDIYTSATLTGVRAEDGFAHLEMNASGLVAYWPFDNDYTQWQEGKMGYGLGPEGFEDGVFVLNNSVYYSVHNDLTISMWLKSHRDFNDEPFTQTAPWVLYNTINDRIDCKIYDRRTFETFNNINSAGDFELWYNSSGSGLRLDEFHHYVWTFNETHSELFIDGDYKGGFALQANLSGFDEGWRFEVGEGASAVGLYSWNGTVDEAKLFNRTLTDQEIADMYANESNGVPDLLDDADLITRFDFDRNFQEKGGYNLPVSGESLDLTAYDYSNNDYDADYFSEAIPQTAIFGNGVKFDGDDYLKHTGLDTSIYGDEVSFFAWVNTSNAEGRILSTQADGGNGYNLYYSSNKYTVILKDSGAWGTCYVSSVGDANQDVNNWVHLGAVYNGDNLTFYINGSFFAFDDCTGGDIEFGASPHYYLGTSNGVVNFFTGMMDDVIIFNRSLSEAEVQEIYENSSSKFYYPEGNMDLQSFSVDLFRANVTVDFDMAKIDRLEDTNVSFRFGFSEGGGYEDNTSNFLAWYKLDEAGKEIDTTEDVAVNLEGLWHLNNNSNDSSTNGFHGTASGGVNLSLKHGGVFNTSADFDGVDDYIDVGNSSVLQLTNQVTLSGWVNLNSDGNNHMIVSKYDSAGNREGYYLMVASSGIVRFVYDTDDNSSYLAVEGVSSVLDGDWHHIAATFNADTDEIVVYVDGQSDGSQNTSISNLGIGSQNLYIGSFQGTGHFANGSIDEVGVWSRALTEAEIADLYERTIVVDSSDYGSNGTLRGPVKDTGRYEDGLWFNNLENDFGFVITDNNWVEIPDEGNPNLDLTRNFTMHAWLKSNNLCPLGCGKGAQVILGKHDDVNSETSYWFYASSDELRFLGSWNGGIGGNNGFVAKNNRSICTMPSEDTWYHVAFVFDNEPMFYIDGQPCGFVVHSGNYTNNSLYQGNASTEIGHFTYFGTDIAIDGTLDEIVIVNDTLTDSEILTVYNSGPFGWNYTDWINLSTEQDHNGIYSFNATLDTVEVDVDVEIHSPDGVYSGIMGGEIIVTYDDPIPGTDACGEITASGNYTLIQDINADGTCLQIKANDVVVDCAGYTITYGNAGAGVGIENPGEFNDITIKNCDIVKGLRNDTSSNNWGIELDDADSATIFNNTINTTGGGSNYGIYLNGASFTYANIYENTIYTDGTGNNNYGIYVFEPDNIIIHNNTVSTNGADQNPAVYVRTNTNATVSYNTLFTNGTGDNNWGCKFLSTSDPVFIYNNVSTFGYDRNYGVYFDDNSYRPNVSGNYFVTNGTNDFNWASLSVDQAHNGSFVDNIVITDGDWWNSGIYFSGVQDWVIYDNEIYSDDVGAFNDGIYINNGQRFEIYDNIINGGSGLGGANAAGTNLIGNTFNVIVRNNDFINHRTAMASASSTKDNEFINNTFVSTDSGSGARGASLGGINITFSYNNITVNNCGDDQPGVDTQDLINSSIGYNNVHVNCSIPSMDGITVRTDSENVDVFSNNVSVWATSASVAYVIFDARNVVLRDNWGYANGSASSAEASQINDAFNVTFVNNYFEADGGFQPKGLYMDSISENVTIINNTFVSNQFGMTIERVNNGYVYNNDFITPNDWAIWIQGATNFLFENNTMVDSGGAFYLTVDAGVYPEYNTFKNNNVSGVGTTWLDLGSVGINHTILIDQVVETYIFDGDHLLSIEDSVYGKINFTSGVGSKNGGNLSAELSIVDNLVVIDSDAAPHLNRSANVELYNIGDRGFIDPEVQRDGVDCVGVYCTVFTAADATDVLFSVTQWSNYSVGESTTYPMIAYVDPTLPDNASTNNTWTEINFSITEDVMAEIKYDWEGTEYGFYNPTLWLMTDFSEGIDMGDTNLWNGLVSLWHLDESSGNAIDAKDDNDGVVMGTTRPSSGIFVNSYSFDGEDDLVNISYNDDFNITDEITFSIWINPANYQHNKGVFSKYGTNDSVYDWGLRMLDGNITAEIFNETEDRLLFNRMAELPVGQWSLVTVTYNGSHGFFYLDGVELDSQYHGGKIHTSSRDVWIGGYHSSGFLFNGSLDEAAVWNRALSADEVLELYEQKVFEDVSLKELELDNFGSEKVEGRVDYAMEFNGTNDYMIVGNETELGTVCHGGCTFGAWVYKHTTGEQTVIARYDETDNNRFWYLGTASGGGANTRFGLTEDGTGGSFCQANGPNMDLNEWHHMLGTYNGSHTFFYYDGILYGQVSCGWSINQSAYEDAEDAVIGAFDSGSNGRWDGLIDEVRIWNRSLSRDEVFLHYQSRLVKKNLSGWNLYINQSNYDGGLENASYDYFGCASNGNLENCTVSRRVNIGTFVDTCIYTSGTWDVDCGQDCFISSPVDLGGNEIFITGEGTFITNASIINFTAVHIEGESGSNKCNVRCEEGGCFIN